MNVESTYAHYLNLTGDVNAAATLTLAAVTAGVKPESDSLLTVSQAAERLQLSQTVIRDACKDGRVRHSRFGRGRGTIRIAAADLDAFRADMQGGTKLHLRHLA